MIIEFTGPSGAGKTTYMKAFLDALARRGAQTGAIHNAALNRCAGIPPVFSELDGQNWRTDIRALPWMLRLFLRHPRFFGFALRKIVTMPEPFSEKLAIIRSLIRKAGIYRFLNSARFDHVIIGVDEGLFHAAHNFLMSAGGHAGKDDITRFAALVPLPGLLVQITAPADVLTRRLRRRGDLSPRIRSREDLALFAENAAALFEDLRQQQRLKDFLVVINSAIDDKTRAAETVMHALDQQKRTKQKFT